MLPQNSTRRLAGAHGPLRPLFAGALLAAPALLFGCTEESDRHRIPESAVAAISTYAQIVESSYADSRRAAESLEGAVESFLDAPSESSLGAAREAWLAAREPYLQTEVYRFYDGPIDDPTTGPEGLMNAWPLDEAYIDYVEGDAETGIVNDPNVPLDRMTLIGLNEDGGEENIATGYHAIEFLLWGQDHSDSGPGDRPHTDFLTDGNGTAAHQDRRGAYLRIVANLLVEHLHELETAWSGGDPERYRAEFESVDAREALRRILTGMIVLSGFETGGERLQTALDSGDQEDEHSCFSDNTHRDMVQDIQGVANVWQGRYRRLDGELVSGTGLRDVVEEVDPELAASLDERIAESLRLANALQPPFDQEIAIGNVAGRARVSALIQSLQTQEALLEDVFRLFDLARPESE